MHRWRRLKMLRERFGTDTSSDSESDLDSDVTSDGLSTDSGTESCNPAGLSTDPPQKGVLTPKNAETAHSLSLRRRNSPHGVVRPPTKVTKRTTGHRIVDINSKSYLSSHSGIASLSQSVPTERKTAVQIDVVTGQIVAAPRTDLSRVEKNQSKQVPRDSDSQVMSEKNLEVEKVEPCSLCSLLVPCHDSDTNQQELIYHIGHQPPNCNLIFDIYQSLLLENLQFYGASLKVCIQCRMTFSVSADLLKHLYTHAVIKAKYVVHQSPASGRARFESVKSFCHGPPASIMQVESEVDKTIPQVFGGNKPDLQTVQRYEADKSKKGGPDPQAGKTDLRLAMSNNFEVISETALRTTESVLPHCDVRSACAHHVQSHYPDTGPTRLNTKSIMPDTRRISC
ncbi:hypothetical protein ElyMa_003655600 [Elysia marginata]|uniref:C2H2-type domain-containing protein n=1 Tax=Elysia marginata TaxID=1093978 RepID=A0AAV4EY44_9GAST|nr:hypothetical protein ElyMa_003655600 [Elysia marginata]